MTNGKRHKRVIERKSIMAMGVIDCPHRDPAICGDCWRRVKLERRVYTRANGEKVVTNWKPKSVKCYVHGHACKGRAAQLRGGMASYIREANHANHP